MSETETVQTFEVILPEPVLTKFEKEKRAFYRLLPDLLQTHRILLGRDVLNGYRIVFDGPDLVLEIG